VRIVVTGAAGTLGRVLLPRLKTAGHAVVAIDLLRGSEDVEWHQADIRDPASVDRAVAKADVIVHGAALHGIHLRDHAPREFFDLNVTGTFNVWEAAIEHSVRGVVFSSTMGVYGDTRHPTADDEVVFLDEEMPLRPGDVYGWSKVVGEELARYHARAHGVSAVALRYGMFVPEPFFRYGIRLLYGGVHEEDVADSVMSAIVAVAGGTVAYETFNVESALPFTPADSADLRGDPLTAVDRHWPGARELLESRGVRALDPITEVFPVHRLVRDLGVTPRRGFGEWLEELKADPGLRAPATPPWP
jgi:UDP-glucose 4-epimerase